MLTNGDKWVTPLNKLLREWGEKYPESTENYSYYRYNATIQQLENRS